MLKALDSDDRITRLGRDIAALPVHPRVARFLLHARDHGGLKDALIMAAIQQAGRILPDTRDWEIKTPA